MNTLVRTRHLVFTGQKTAQEVLHDPDICYTTNVHRPATAGRKGGEFDMLQIQFLAVWARARCSDSDRGASLVEYALLVALIAVVCIGAVTLLGSNASSKFSKVATSISN